MSHGVLSAFRMGLSRPRGPFRLRGRLALGIVLLLVPECLAAQRLVPSRPWPSDASEWAAKIQLVADSAIAPEASRRASHAGIIFRTVVGFRADSVLVE